MKIQKKETRESHSHRWFEIYLSRHSCSSFRGEEKGRIQSSGQFETNCPWCGTGGMLFFGKPRGYTCNHPGYYMEYQCLNCRYHCHKKGKAKLHADERGHKVKLVKLYYRIKPNRLESRNAE